MAAEKVHAKTESFVTDVKSALHGIHGAGEVLRGGSMQALDGVFHKQDGEARNKAIAEHGIAEIEPGRERFENTRSEHAHSHGIGAGHGPGSHFASARANGNQAHSQSSASVVNGRTALDAARKAASEGPERNA